MLISYTTSTGNGLAALSLHHLHNLYSWNHPPSRACIFGTNRPAEFVSSEPLTQHSLYPWDHSPRPVCILRTIHSRSRISVTTYPACILGTIHPACGFGSQDQRYRIGRSRQQTSDHTLTRGRRHHRSRTVWAGNAQVKCKRSTGRLSACKSQ